MSRRSRIFHDSSRRRAPRPRRRERKRHQLTFRRRRNVNVAAMVSSPEELTGRPALRLNIMGVVVLVLFVVLILRLWALQVIDHKTYSAAVNANEVRTAAVPAPRGLITTRDGTVLAGNQVRYQITLSRPEVAQDPAIVGPVAALVHKTPAQIQADVNNSQYSPYAPVPVDSSASMTIVQYLQEHRSEFPGVSVQQVTERHYPQGGTVASQVIGYVNAITPTELKANPTGRYGPATPYGQSGLENQYQSYLAGKSGAQRLLVNAQGQVVGTLHSVPAVQGDTLVTNLDLGLQKAVQGALQAVVTADRHSVDPTTGKVPAAKSAAAVVMDVQSGAVLAMASYPTYSLTEWIGGISQANFTAIKNAGSLNNYAIQGLFTPGSSFKLASATAALQTGLMSPYVPFTDPGHYTIPGCTGSSCTYHDNTQSDAGSITMPLALTESDDDYFYNIGYQFYVQPSKYGATPIQNVANQYGLGTMTGIDLPDEVQGQVDSPALRKALHTATPKNYPYDTWYAATNLEMAFGQGETQITPIEMAQAYATFANGGTRYQPQVAAAVVTPGSTVVKQFAPKVTGHVNLPASIYQPMLQGFEGVVATPKGTAYGTFKQYAKFSLTQFRIAGKTGSATVSSGTAVEPDAWFVGFGPEPNPQYVVVVAVAQGGYGASAAAPAVMNIFNYLVGHPVGPVSLPKPTPATPSTTTTAPGGTTSTTKAPGGTTSTTKAPGG